MLVVRERQSRTRDPVALAVLEEATERLEARGLPSAMAGAAGPPPNRAFIARVSVVALAMVAVTASVVLAADIGTGPCAPIPYIVDAGVGPVGAVELIEEVLDEVEALSGLRFVPADQNGDDGRVSLAWAPDADTEPRSVAELGRAAAVWHERDGVATIRSGEVLFRSLAEAERIEGGPVDWRTVARHEIGHLLGVPHRVDPQSVMYPILTSPRQRWTSEDRAALAGRGRAAGCAAAAR